MNQHPNQPRALIGNPVSDAYFSALRQRSAVRVALCAHCGADLRGVPRVSDGDASWCDHGHRELWLRNKRDEAMRRALAERGWTADRQRAADEVKTPERRR